MDVDKFKRVQKALAELQTSLGVLKQNCNSALVHTMQHRLKNIPTILSDLAREQGYDPEKATIAERKANLEDLAKKKKAADKKAKKEKKESDAAAKKAAEAQAKLDKAKEDAAK